MRTTLHLTTADDAVALAPLMAGVMSRAFRAQRAFREAVDGLELDELIAVGTAAIEEQPRTPADLGRILGARWPGRDPQALSLAIRYFVPIVQITPRGLWGQKMQPTITTVAAWSAARFRRRSRQKSKRSSSFATCARSARQALRTCGRGHG